MHIKINYIILLLFAISIYSCNTKKENAPEPGAHITILKFKKTEYKNYVLTTLSPDKKSYLMMEYNVCIGHPRNPNNPIDSIPYIPHSLYWELTDDWLLLDWRWIDFPYGGHKVLIYETWDKISGPYEKWPLNFSHNDNSIDSIYTIPTKQIGEFIGKPYSEYFLGIRSAQSSDYDVCEVADRQDSAWSVLVTDVSLALRNGYLKDKNYKSVALAK